MAIVFGFVIAILVAFAAGLWLAPVLRGDYLAFKLFVEEKLHLAEQKAKDRAIGIVNKL